MTETLTCSTCKQPLRTAEAAILWDDRFVGDVDTVTALVVVHNDGCDDDRLPSSAGCVYGTDWHPDEHGTYFFRNKTFARSADRALFNAVIAQRRIDYQVRERDDTVV